MCVCVCVFFGVDVPLVVCSFFFFVREKRKVVVVVAVADCSYHHLLHMPKFALITFVSDFGLHLLHKESLIISGKIALTFSPSLCV